MCSNMDTHYSQLKWEKMTDQLVNKVKRITAEELDIFLLKTKQSQDQTYINQTNKS